jgi:hypothetical protein
MAIWWWYRHSRTQFFTLVVPPWALCRMWWTSQAAAGRRQPGNRQCRSRRCTRFRMPAGMVLLAPMSSGRLGPASLSPSCRCRTNDARPPGPDSRSTAFPMMTCSSASHAPVVPGLAGTRVVLAAAGVPWQPRQSSWTHSPHEILEHGRNPGQHLQHGPVSLLGHAQLPQHERSVKHQAEPMCKASSGTAQWRTPGRCENFLYVFKGAQGAPRAGRRTCKSAARRDRCPNRGASTIRCLAGHLRTLPAPGTPGLPLLGPAGPRRRPARVVPEVAAPTDDSAASPALARGVARGAIPSCPGTQALQVHRQARL